MPQVPECALRPVSQAVSSIAAMTSPTGKTRPGETHGAEGAFKICALQVRDPHSVLS